MQNTIELILFLVTHNGSFSIDYESANPFEEDCVVITVGIGKFRFRDLITKFELQRATDSSVVIDSHIGDILAAIKVELGEN